MTPNKVFVVLMGEDITPEVFSSEAKAKKHLSTNGFRKERGNNGMYVMKGGDPNDPMDNAYLWECVVR